MKKAGLAVVLGLVLLELMLLTAPAGAADGELRDLTGFNAVSVGGGIDLEVRQGPVFRVEVTAPDGESANVVTEVRNSTLFIGTENGFFRFRSGYSVAVTLPELVSLSVGGGTDADLLGPFTGDSLEVKASGGSDVNVDVSVETLATSASGGSDLRMAGTAGRLRVSASGGSDVDAAGLDARAAEVSASGGSDVRIQVSDSLVAQASGGSDIVYAGDPATKTVNSSGGSDVKAR